MQYTYYYKSPLGVLTLTGEATHLTGLRFGKKEPMGQISQKLPVFRKTCQWLDCYFSGRNPTFIPPISITDTPFREQVWQLLLKIPYGKTTTYGTIATQIAHENNLKKMSAQAVGNAVGHNPIALIIPCHRVLGANGNLTGYAAGLNRKIYLLNLEGVNYGLL